MKIEKLNRKGLKYVNWTLFLNPIQLFLTCVTNGKTEAVVREKFIYVNWTVKEMKFEYY